MRVGCCAACLKRCSHDFYCAPRWRVVVSVTECTWCSSAARRSAIELRRACAHCTLPCCISLSLARLDSARTRAVNAYPTAARAVASGLLTLAIRSKLLKLLMHCVPSRRLHFSKPHTAALGFIVKTPAAQHPRAPQCCESRQRLAARQREQAITRGQSPPRS
jgi:hypothetical protein